MIENNTALQLEIAELMVQALNLDVAAAEIEPDAPLYGWIRLIYWKSHWSFPSNTACNLNRITKIITIFSVRCVVLQSMLPLIKPNNTVISVPC
jgi:hypothetical protein